MAAAPGAIFSADRQAQTVRGPAWCGWAWFGNREDFSGGKLNMTSVIDKPRIQCRYRNDEGWQCPLEALDNEEYCRFHLPK